MKPGSQQPTTRRRTAASRKSGSPHQSNRSRPPRRPVSTDTRRAPKNVYRRSRDEKPSTALRSSMSPDGQQVCLIKSECGSCSYINEDYEKRLEEKYQAGLKILGDAGLLGNARILPPVKSPRRLEYRSHFKLAVRQAQVGKTTTPPADRSTDHGPSPAAVRPQAPSLDDSREPERFSIGLFKPGTHQVIDVDDCPLHMPPLQRLIKDLKHELERSTLEPYSEHPVPPVENATQLRYLAARAAHLTGAIMLTFIVTNKDAKQELIRIVGNLRRRDHKIQAAHMNINGETNNVIFGQETLRLAGADKLRERLCDLDFEVSPTAFFQVNPWQAINLYRRIEQLAGVSSTNHVAWDLYCGTGQISLVLARSGYRVLGIEENERAVVDARHNARKNRLESRVEFIPSRVEDVIHGLPSWASRPEFIVVNPSRRGLAPNTREFLKNLLAVHSQSRFMYVSCEVQTLARDLVEICMSGFKLRQIEGFDMFPQTANMEWLAVLTR